MAFMSQEKKAEIAPLLKAICKKYNVQASVAVRNHSTLVLNIKSGKLDFIGNSNKVIANRPGDFRGGSPAKTHMSVNPYWYHEHFDGKCKDFLTEVITAMNKGNHDRSDIQSDYFDVGWYTDVNVGAWNKPYELVA